jgi:hypothetical protein
MSEICAALVILFVIEGSKGALMQSREAAEKPPRKKGRTQK